MKRALVIGCSGSGKTTFAVRLAELTGLPLIHLDSHYWLPDWQLRPEAEWKALVCDLVARDRWIMDGNFGETLDFRLQACDAVFFLDFPRAKCLTRVLRRWFTYHNRPRPGMPMGCRERLDWGFLAWIWTYRSRRRPGVVERLRALEGRKTVVVLRSDSEIERFLSGSPLAADMG